MARVTAHPALQPWLSTPGCGWWHRLARWHSRQVLGGRDEHQLPWGRKDPSSSAPGQAVAWAPGGCPCPEDQRAQGRLA